MNILSGLVAATFLVAGYIAYLQYQPKTVAPSTVKSQDKLDTLKLETRKMVSDLRQLENINLDTSVFKSDEYQSLQDFTVSIDESTLGRDNPFDPIQIKRPNGNVDTLQTGSKTTEGQGAGDYMFIL